MTTERHFETKTGLQVDIQHSQSGKQESLILAIDGDVFVFHHTDACRLAACLQEVAATAKHISTERPGT